MYEFGLLPLIKNARVVITPSMYCRWLLHDPNMVLCSNYAPYTKAVSRYFTWLFKVLGPLQSSYGGPIIGFQVENEYGYWTNDTTARRAHLQFLHKVS